MSTNPPAPEPQGSPVPPAYPAPAPGHPAAPPAGQYGAPQGTPKGTSTLGLIAFFATVAAVVIGSVLAYIGGLQLGFLVQYVGPDGTADTSNLPPQAEGAAIAGGLLVFLAYGAMAVLGLWGLIQGIVAAVKNRGRGWAIAAIVIAVLAVVPVSIFVGLGTTVGAGPFLY